MRFRRVMAGGVVAVVAGALALAPGSADPADPADTEPGATGTAVDWNTGLGGPAPCPEGDSRTATLGKQEFRHGIPQWDFANGWYRDSGAVQGQAARSDVNGSDSVDWMFLDWAQARVGARTMLAFATKGNTPSSLARADVNSVSNQVSVPSRWGGRVYDVTAATDDEGGRLGTWFEQRRAAGTSTTWWLDNIQIYSCADNDTTRIEGSNRYSTSAQVSKLLPANVDVAYLAAGANFPDALGGAAVAGKHGGPVLLVRKDDIPRAIEIELERLNPEKIVVLGGSAAVSDDVRTAARRYSRSGEVERLFGQDRYGTSAAIAATYPAGLSRVYVATGRSYPDALTGGAQAARLDAPVVFTSPTGIPDPVADQLERLNPHKIVVVGGTAAVPQDQIDDLAAYTRSGEVVRIAGDDRYETSARIAALYPEGLPRVFVATGQDFPDALSGAAVAGSQEVPVLLTRPEALPDVVRSRIAAQDADQGVVLGGTAVVGSLVRDQLGRAVN